MLINYSIDAFASLVELINFIESKNTKGAGVRWLTKYEAFLQNALHNPQKVSLCNNQTFNELNLRCINYNDWIIAFSIEESSIQIEALLHKSRISN